MNERRKILTLTGIMLTITFGVSAILIITMYKAAVEQEKRFLVQFLHQQHAFIDEILRIDMQSRKTKGSGNVFATVVIDQIKEIYNHSHNQRETFEISVGKREGDRIVYLVQSRNRGTKKPVSVLFSSEAAKPIRYALTKKSGTLVYRDDRGHHVIAAYEPLPALNLGLVATVDLQEVRHPFLATGFFAAGCSLLLIFLGLMLFKRVGRDLFQHIEILAKFPSENPYPVLRIAKDYTLQYANKASLPLLDTLDCKIGNQVPEIWRNATDEAFKSKSYKPFTMNFGNRIYSVVISVVTENEFAYAYGMDITEQVQLQDRLRQSQKMEAIGTLTAGIAHDFNNILTPLLGYSDMLIDNIKENSRARNHVEHIIKASNRAKELVRKILMFSRQSNSELKPMRMIPILEETMDFLTTVIPSTIKTSLKINTDRDEIIADSSQIHEIIMNIGTNAYHAMQENGGCLSVCLDTDMADDNLLSFFPDMKKKPYVRLTISDTGHGMNSAVIEKIFNPFFTTKEVGKGTGLGLSMIHGILNECGGEIDVSSEPGKGTTFTIYLPHTEDEIIEDNRHNEMMTHGNECVLFVDDEKEIALMAKGMLEPMGYKVTALTNSSDALETFRQSPDEFEIIITDLTMPEMSGKHLAEELLKIRSDIPIIIITGYHDEKRENNLLNVGIREIIQKPLTRHDVARAVRQVLDQKPNKGTLVS